MFTRNVKNIFTCGNYFMISHRLQSTSSNLKHYDIVVAGGGLVGTTLACTLAKNPKLSNKRILLLESNKETHWKLPERYSNRVSALNQATYNLLNEIGAWENIENVRFGPVKRMQVWESLSDAGITFEHDLLEEPIAYIVENDVLLNAVKKETSGLDTVDVVYQSKIKGCTSPEDECDVVTVSLENGDNYTCNLLLGCDGANSVVRREMGIHWIWKNYNHMGVVATLKLPEDFNNVVAWQRHLPDSGFLALLPLKNGFSSMVWSTNTEEAKRLCKLSDNEFVETINDALFKTYDQSKFVNDTVKGFDNFIRFLDLPSSSQRQIPPKILGCDEGSRAAFPLGVGHATNYIGKGVALVGDAAHRVHPLAGQGVNLGFGDVICLNKVLEEAVYNGSNIENILYLRDYETERQRHNVPMLLSVHGVFQLHNTQFTPIVLLRSLGLQATHALTPLKKFFISQAAGRPYWQ